MSLRLLAFSAFSLGILIISACGGRSDEKAPVATTAPAATSAPAPTSAPATSNTPAAASTPLRPAFTTGTVFDSAMPFFPYEIENVRYGGTFKSQNSYANGSLDTKLISGSPIIYFSRMYADRVVSWEANTNDHLVHLVPGLAESWKISEDLKTYTFTIRKGVRWQNIAPANGRELTAEDVLFNINRYREKNSILAPLFNAIDSAEQTDKSTIVIKLKEPSGWALQDIFTGSAYLHNPELIKESGGELAQKVIGTGPYIQKDYVFRQGATYVRNPDYWGKDAKGNRLPYLDTVNTTFIQDAGTILAAFRTGQLDQGGIRIDNIPIVVKELPNIRLYGTGLPSVDAVAFNTKKAPWNDVNLRRAFNMALDKQKVIDALTVTGKYAWGFPLPWSYVSDKPFTFDDYGPYYKYNPTEAKKLLIAAGFPDGKIKAPMLYGATGNYEQIALVWKDLYKKEGIELEMTRVDDAAYKTQWFLRTYSDLTMNHILTGDYSLNWFAQNKFGDSQHNSSFIDDPEVTKVVKAIKVTSDPTKLREYARFLWDFDTRGSWNVWIPRDYGFGVASAHTRNYTVRTSDNFTGLVHHPWLSDAPRTQP